MTEANVTEAKSGRFETLKTVIVAASLAIVIRSFLFEPFHIPSGSMKNTLEIGDFIFVNKYSYGYSRYSFPLGLPIFEGRKLEFGQPKRGDIIVFRPPGTPHIDYIKRLIGLPGDRIQVTNGVLHINGKAVKLERLDDYMDTETDNEKVTTKHIPQFRETLPNGVSHSVLDDFPHGEVDNTQEYTVPAGHYFFMGDNRDHSVDSRYPDVVGFVPAENLVGRATLLAFSVKEGESALHFWKWPSVFRSGRFFHWLTNDVNEEAAPHE